MMQFLEFTFQTFWHFTGVCLLIVSVGAATSEILKALKGLFK